MKRFFPALAVVAILLSAVPATAQSFNLSDLLGKVGESLGNNSGSAVGSLIDGVFTKEKLNVSDIAGTWQSGGPAVDFRSESLLKKAGGAAAASAIESKLAPYFTKYGFDTAIVTITAPDSKTSDDAQEGEITLQVGRVTLKGSIRPNDDKRYAGNFIVCFKALGVMRLGEYDTYVSLTDNPLTGSRQLKIMFDAQKLMAMMKGVAAVTKSKLAKSAVSMLEGYDGICVGFKCQPATIGKTE